MTLTMEHVVTQLQKAQVAGQSGLADAVREPSEISRQLEV